MTLSPGLNQVETKNIHFEGSASPHNEELDILKLVVDLKSDLAMIRLRSDIEIYSDMDGGQN